MKQKLVESTSKKATLQADDSKGKQTTIYLSPELRRRIARYQVEEEELTRPRNDLIVEALSGWLKERGY